MPVTQTRYATPSPKQLFELAGECIKLGKEGDNRLTRHNRDVETDDVAGLVVKKGLGRMLVFKTDFLSNPKLTFEDLLWDTEVTDFLSVSRQYLGMIALARDQYWRMKIKEKNSVYRGASLVDEIHLIHQFKWSGQGVLQATRRTHIVDLEKAMGENYQPITLDSSAFQPDFLAVVNDGAIVNSLDCEQLIADISAFNTLQQA